MCIFAFTACSKSEIPESDVYTLYSTNWPHNYGRSGVATYDLAKEPFNSVMCQEAADLHKADFEKRKIENSMSLDVKTRWNSDDTMRYWCEKGRFKK
jgi:hypothetical protein